METLNKADIQHKVLIVIVNRNWDGRDSSLYEAACFAWKVQKSRAERSEVILASYNRKIVGAFIAEEWLEATAENFPGRGRGSSSDRYGFIGREASSDIQNLYVGKRTSDELRGYGGSFRYVNC